MSAGWTQNTRGTCSNPACAQDIWWNDLITSAATGRRRPLNSPYFPDHGQDPDIHICPTNWSRYEEKQKPPPKEDPFPHIPKPYPPGVILGVTHLWWRNEFVRFLKCPFCNFRNIHEDTITHHIKFTKDNVHKDIQIETLDKSTYIVR